MDRCDCHTGPSGRSTIYARYVVACSDMVHITATRDRSVAQSIEHVAEAFHRRYVRAMSAGVYPNIHTLLEGIDATCYVEMSTLKVSRVLGYLNTLYEMDHVVAL